MSSIMGDVGGAQEAWTDVERLKGTDSGKARPDYSVDAELEHKQRLEQHNKDIKKLELLLQEHQQRFVAE